MEGEDSGPHTAPPGWGELFIVGTSLTNGKTHDKTQPSRRGMEGLPTFRNDNQVYTNSKNNSIIPSNL